MKRFSTTGRLFRSENVVSAVDRTLCLVRRMRFLMVAVFLQSVCYAYKGFPLPVRRLFSVSRRVQSGRDSERAATPLAETCNPQQDPASSRYLELKNPHKLDPLLTFNDDLHKYTFDHQPLAQSVTAVVSSYFEKFVPEKVVEKMMNGNNWPRPEYTHPDGTPYLREKILAQWESIGKLARDNGTLLHADIEAHFNNMDVSSPLPEFKQFVDFKKEVLDVRGVTPFRTEWRIAAPDLSLGGSVDFVGVAKDGSYVIMDWKRSKNLPKSIYASYGKKGSGPLAHLPDCDGSKYGLQLNMYRYILKKYYDISISSMTLASFHPALDKFFITEIPVMEAEIAAIVNDIAKKV